MKEKLDKEIHSTLLNFGLNDKEITIYLAALRLEETSPNELSKVTGIPRTTIYDIMLTLSLKGLIELHQSDGFTKQQTKIKAKNPSVLRQVIRDRHKELSELEVDIVGILPKLRGDFHKDSANADFKFYPGIEGARHIYFNERHLDIELPRYVFTKLLPMDVFGLEEVNQDIEKEKLLRKKSGKSLIPVKELIPLNDWTKHILTYQTERDPEYLIHHEYRFIDNPIFNVYNRFTIIGSKILIVCEDSDEIWGLAINSRALSKTMLSLFNLIWMTATPVTEKLVKSWGKNQFLKAERRKKKSK